MAIADGLRFVGPPDGSEGIIHIEATETGKANRVLVFSQREANSPHHKFEWMLEVQPDHSVILMRVERDEAGTPLPGGFLGVCKFKFDGHVRLGPFDPNDPRA